MHDDLGDRRIVVTGGASGIGRSVATLAAEQGAAVAVVDNDGVGAATVADELVAAGGRAIGLTADVGSDPAVRAAIECTVGELGGVDGVVTAAGVFRPDDLRPLGEVELDVFLDVLRVNLAGTFLAIKHAAPHLVEHGGAVVTIASTAALRGHGFGSGYTASKGGVTALTRLVAVQYGPQRVRANCICPGGVDTPMASGSFDNPDARERTRRAVPLGVVAQPEQIASVACFLLSDGASHLTGQTIAIDGGATIKG